MISLRIAFLQVIFAAMILSVTRSGSAHAQEHHISVITHSSVSSKAMDAAQLRRIFSMLQMVWPSGEPILVFVLSGDSQVHQTFCKGTLRMFPYQLDRQWNKLTYSGLGDIPIAVGSEQEMLEMVRSTPGAIGYLSHQPASPDVHVLDIIKE